MRESCIAHPAGQPLVIIRKWQLDYCDGDRVAAALLGFFEYWHNIKIDMSEKSKHANATAEAHGDIATQDTSLWQFHTEQELEDGILIFRRRRIGEAIELLCSKGAITVGSNPNPRYSFDRTRFFLFHPEVINEHLISINPSRKSASSSRKSAGRSRKSVAPSSKSASTIPETTTETTSESNTPSDSTSTPIGSRKRSPKATTTNPPQARNRNDFWDYFASQYEHRTGNVYISAKGDYAQLANLRKACTAAGKELEYQDWSRAVLNYLDSPIGNHTVRDLASRFNGFLISAMDRFGKPVNQKGIENERKISSDRKFSDITETFAAVREVIGRGAMDGGANGGARALLCGVGPENPNERESTGVADVPFHLD